VADVIELGNVESSDEISMFQGMVTPNFGNSKAKLVFGGEEQGSISRTSGHASPENQNSCLSGSKFFNNNFEKQCGSELVRNAVENSNVLEIKDIKYNSDNQNNRNLQELVPRI